MDESLRKTLQREIQKLTLKLRKEGKDKKEIKVEVNKLKRKLKGPKVGKKGNKRGRQERSDKEWEWDGVTGKKFKNEFADVDPDKQRRREELGRKHDIIIVPIFFKRDAEQAVKILESANVLKTKLAAHKLNVWIDQRKSLTPGQKYAYWEHIGVRFRAEIGPQELEANSICLSKTTTPGNLAKRWKKVKVLSRDDIHKLIQRLKTEGLSFLDTEIPCNLCSADDYAAPEKKLPESEDDYTATTAKSAMAQRNEPTPSKVAPVIASGDSLDVNYVLE
mmetsp:Transcript_14676/g.19252  ORF Transcript_14676/g.19252 Transcript_14676/m.19252 type:complete len:277 (-) Transcript_14676:812-1642(-)